MEMPGDSQGCSSQFQLELGGRALGIGSRTSGQSRLHTGPALRPWADDNVSEPGVLTCERRRSPAPRAESGALKEEIHPRPSESFCRKISVII